MRPKVPGGIVRDLKSLARHGESKPTMFDLNVAIRSGPGIGPKHLGRIFETFFTTKGATLGSR